MYEANYPEILKTCLIINGNWSIVYLLNFVFFFVKKRVFLTDNLSVIYCLAAPKVFAFAFSITKKFMNEYTISKIQIHKADPVRWKSEILKIAAKDQLPEHFGGTLKDPDGNPRLTTKVRQPNFSIKVKLSETFISNSEQYRTIVNKKSKN